MAKLANVKREAIALLSKNIPQGRVAEIIGVNRRTISRWLKSSEFREELFNNRRDHLESVLEKVVESTHLSVENEKISTSHIDSLIIKSIAALDTIVSCPESRNSDRIRASELILKLVGSDRVIQSFTSKNSMDGSNMQDENRSSEIERLLERREQLKNRIAVLKNQQG